MSNNINPGDSKDKSKGFFIYLAGRGDIDYGISNSIINQCFRKFNKYEDIFYQAGHQIIEFDNHGHCYFSVDKKYLEFKRILTKKENKQILDKVKFDLVGNVDITPELAREIYRYVDIAKTLHSGDISDFVFKMLFHRIEISNNVAQLKSLFEN